MTLVPSQVNGLWQLSGMTDDPTVSAPLGRRYFHVGAHWLGFDDSFAAPVIVRAYYDVSADENTRLNLLDRDTYVYVGYQQFMRLSFRGMPIPPRVYGGRLADRQPYVYGNDLRFIDFMGPAEANARGLTTPMYPFNAMLVDGTLTNYTQFFNYPLPNGCLCARGTRSDRALAASLAGEIAPGLVTPAAVARLLNDRNLLLPITVPNAQLAQSEAYRIALDFLENRPLPDAADEPPPLAGLDETQVAAEVIGDYVMLTLPDPENFGDTLVISTAPHPGDTTSTDIVVHVLSEYDMEGLFGYVANDALWRIRDYQQGQGLTSQDQTDVVSRTGRGTSGLSRLPYVLSPDEFVLELRYWTLLVASYRITTRAADYRRLINGISWAALFQFDEMPGVMSLAAIREPELVTSFDLKAGLTAYQSAVGSASGSIDVSNFTKAAMRRENFAAGNKLSFVDHSGHELT